MKSITRLLVLLLLVHFSFFPAYSYTQNSGGQQINAEEGRAQLIEISKATLDGYSKMDNAEIDRYLAASLEEGKKLFTEGKISETEYEKMNNRINSLMKADNKKEQIIENLKNNINAAQTLGIEAILPPLFFLGLLSMAIGFIVLGPAKMAGGAAGALGPAGGHVKIVLIGTVLFLGLGGIVALALN